MHDENERPLPRPANVSFPEDRQTAQPQAVVAYGHLIRGVVSATLDGLEIGGWLAQIPLADDGQLHRVRVELGCSCDGEFPIKDLTSGATGAHFTAGVVVALTFSVVRWAKI